MLLGICPVKHVGVSSFMFSLFFNSMALLCGEGAGCTAAATTGCSSSKGSIFMLFMLSKGLLTIGCKVCKAVAGIILNVLLKLLAKLEVFVVLVVVLLLLLRVVLAFVVVVAAAAAKFCKLLLLLVGVMLMAPFEFLTKSNKSVVVVEVFVAAAGIVFGLEANSI